jgi:hypothetical protein
MELQPGDFSLRAKYQRNVVAAFVSTDTRWIGFSEDDVRGPPKAKIKSGGKAAFIRQRVEDNAFHLCSFP